MKNLKLSGITTLSILMLAFVLITASCSKRKALKNIDGTWNLVSISDGTGTSSTVITGSFTFETCSGSDNKSGNCTMSYDITYDYGFGEENEVYTGPYQIKDKGEHVAMLGLSWAISITDNSMTLTYSDNGDVIVYNFTR
jgi:hypothetical protein